MSSCMHRSEHGPLTRYVKLRVLHAPGMPGTFSPPAEFKWNHQLATPACITARESRTCRDACRDCLPAVAGKTFPAFPSVCAPAILHIWQEAHCGMPYLLMGGSCSVHIRLKPGTFYSLPSCLTSLMSGFAILISWLSSPDGNASTCITAILVLLRFVLATSASSMGTVWLKFPEVHGDLHVYLQSVAFCNSNKSFKRSFDINACYISATLCSSHNRIDVRTLKPPNFCLLFHWYQQNLL